MDFVERVVAPDALDNAVDGWLDDIGQAAPLAIRSQKASMATWQSVSLDAAILAGIDAFATADPTGGLPTTSEHSVLSNARDNGIFRANFPDSHTYL